MEEIICKTQQELDAVPVDFAGRIIIKFGTFRNRAVLNRLFQNASVEAWGNASVVAWGNASVEARGNASVEAWGNASVEARGNASVEAWGNASVVAWGNASVVARGNAIVEALENASVVARENASVEAWGNAQICVYDNSVKFKMSGNSRAVFPPKNVDEFISFNGLKRTKTYGFFFKAVHKRYGHLISNHDANFEYFVGKTAKADQFNDNPAHSCSYGIHFSSMHGALDYGHAWNDLTILEVKVKIADCVFPGETKLRAPSVFVVREVPLEECGLYGKMLKNRMEAKK